MVGPGPISQQAKNIRESTVQRPHSIKYKKMIGPGPIVLQAKILENQQSSVLIQLNKYHRMVGPGPIILQNKIL